MQGRDPSFWPALSGSALTTLTLLAGLVAGCGQHNYLNGTKVPRSDIADHIREVDLSPRMPQGGATGNAVAPQTGASAATFYGEATPTPQRMRVAGTDPGPSTTGTVPDGPATTGNDKGYEINFENTPVATVVKAILGDILGLGYTIDPRVQGTVSLSTGRAVPRRDLLYVLESALRVNNISLVRDGRGYRLIPAGDSVGNGVIDGGGGLDAGLGISAVPLQHVSAQTIIKLLDNFAAKQGMVRADPSRNLIVIQGTAAERRAAIEAALSFDADWMRGQSVGIYPVSNSTPEPIISELERIIDSGEGGLGQNVVKLQPITRQNAILVVTRRPDLLRTVATWITRLDRSGNAGTGVKVYRMRYGDARQVAALLNDIFVGGSSNTLDSPLNQLAPRNGVVPTSSNPPQQVVSGPQARAAAAAGVTDQPSTGPANFETRFDPTRQGQNGPPPSSNTPSPGTSGSILPNVRITADVINNSLLIYASPENYRIIERTLQQLDRPQRQVAIDATIAEITLNDQLNYGVQIFLKSKDVGLPADSGSLLNTGINTATSAVLQRVLPGFNFLVGTEAEPRVILDALHAVTDVKILSTPSLVVVDNQTASLTVGDQIPITTRTAQSVDVPTAPVVNNIDYRNTGVILRVAPRINANGNVLLDVEQEISAVSTTSSTGALTPTISQRKVKSSIAVTSGQTVLLGGLISERQDAGRNGVPGLDQIPGLGDVFSRTTGAKQRTELIIFIRPQIIRNGIDASRVAEELRAKMRGRFIADPPAIPCVIGCQVAPNGTRAMK